MFFVEDHRVANQLLDCNNRITTSDGFKMRVQVRPGPPPVEINEALKERLKQAMGKRYVQERNALDLSKFYHDPGNQYNSFLFTLTLTFKYIYTYM